MKIFVLLFTLPFLFFALIWQTGRYTALASDAQRLANEQLQILEDNNKSLGEIYSLTSRAQIEARALEYGLQKAKPENRTLVVPSKTSKGGVDG